MKRFRGDVHVARISLLGQQNRFRDSDAELRGDGIIEELVVGSPPKGIVDDVSSLKNSVFEVAAIIFDLVRDAVNDDAVAGRLAHARAAELCEFSSNAVFFSEFIDANDEGWRKAVFTPAEKANLFHDDSPDR